MCLLSYDISLVRLSCEIISNDSGKLTLNRLLPSDLLSFKKSFLTGISDMTISAFGFSFFASNPKSTISFIVSSMFLHLSISLVPMWGYNIIYYYILLYIIIYYYMLLYVIICYYMLLYVIIYYYILLYIILALPKPLFNRTFFALLTCPARKILHVWPFQNLLLSIC